MSHDVKVLVTGAGGFIGHHLVTFLKFQGYWVRGVDSKYPEYRTTDADEHNGIREPSKVAWITIEGSQALLLVARKIPFDI